MGRFHFRTTEGIGGFKLAYMFFCRMDRSRQRLTEQIQLREGMGRRENRGWWREKL